MYSYLVVDNFKELTFEFKCVYLIVCLSSNCIKVIFLSIKHICSIAKVLLDKPLVKPGHFVPSFRNIWVITEYV